VEAVTVGRDLANDSTATDVYLLRRGWSTAHPPEYTVPSGLDWLIVRGDGNAVAAFSRGGRDGVDFFVDTGAGTLRRVRSVDVEEHAGFVPFSWAAGTPIYGVPICFCQGTGDAADRWALEPSGRLTKAAWLGRSFTVEHSASADGSMVAYVFASGGTCQFQDFGSESPCVEPTYRLRVANTRARTTRDVAVISGDADPLMSPDGSLVALDESERTRIIDVASGRVVWNRRGEGIAVAWVGEHLLVEDTDADADVFVLLRRSPPGSAVPYVAEEIARGSDLDFLGWLR
jgi:hypothetical protein